MKFLLNFFFYMLASNVFTEGILGISFLSLNNSENTYRNTENTDRKHFHNFLRNKMYIIKQIIYEQIPE